MTGTQSSGIYSRFCCCFCGHVESKHDAEGARVCHFKSCSCPGFHLGADFDPPVEKPRTRACLRCQKGFRSLHKGNRICRRCKETNSDIQIPDAYVALGMAVLKKKPQKGE